MESSKGPNFRANLITLQTQTMKVIQRNFPTFLLLLAVLAILSACAPKPTSVAQKYFTALENRDYDKAREYLTASSITNFNKLFEGGKEPATTYTVLRVEMDESNENKAKVYYTENGDSTENYIELEKVDGDWKIVIPDLSGSGGDYK